MLDKLKKWIFGKVIFKKVIGKYLKHGATALTGLLFGDKLMPVLGPIFEAMELTEGQVEAGLIVAMTGLAGALWNFIEHRITKK